MDQGAMDTRVVGATATPSSIPDAAARRRRRRLAVDLTALAVIGALLVAALAATVGILYREFYSPTAFVERYLGLLADGRAAEALAVPGVAVDSAELEAAGLPPVASDVLLRRDALAALTDVHIVSEITADDVSRVTAKYRAGAFAGETTFEVERSGSTGVAPTWRFAQSPLALVDLVVRGSMGFDVNGFAIDKRQVSPDGLEADPLAPLALLVFSPGIYSVSVDSAISATPGAAVLSDSPFTSVPVDLQAEPTDKLVSVVQERVDEFLASCATQEVLQPTGCPFGFSVKERLASLPTWSIAQGPVVTLVPDGNGWSIPPTDAVAHIDVDIRSLFDGSVRNVDEDVPFILTARVEILPDSTVSITVGGPEGT